MSYRRDRQKMVDRQEEQDVALLPSTFEFVGHSGRVMAYTDYPEEVVTRARSYRADPELRVVGLNTYGHEVQDWTISEVLDGTFEASISAP